MTGSLVAYTGLTSAVGNYSVAHEPGHRIAGPVGTRASIGSLRMSNFVYPDGAVKAYDEGFRAFFDYVTNAYVFWHQKD